MYKTKNAATSHSVDILQRTCYQQADIRTRSHGLRQLLEHKSVANCQKTCCKFGCQNVLATGLLQVVSTSCNQPDFNRLVFRLDKTDKFVATCQKVATSLAVKLGTCIKFVAIFGQYKPLR